MSNPEVPNFHARHTQLGTFFDSGTVLEASPPKRSLNDAGLAVRGEEGLGQAPTRRGRSETSPAYDVSVPLDYDTTDGIFTQRFVCKIPFWATYSDEAIRSGGMLSTGDKRYDKQMHNQLSQVVITIDQMVEHHRRGVPIVIADASDIDKIYDNVQKHLSAWRTHLSTSFNVAEAPTDDLLLLNDFASLLFKYVRKAQVEKLNRDILTTIQNAGWLNMAEVLRNPTPKAVAAKEKISIIENELKADQERTAQFQNDILRLTRNQGMF